MFRSFILAAGVLTAIVAAMPAHAGVRKNGLSFNGAQLNGAQLNGRALQGLSLNGRALQGTDLGGFSAVVEAIELPPAQH